MFWTVLALISLVVLGGFISYYGDLQGRRWGKKRVSWFGLRPKYTAVLITSLTGAFVALLSIVTLLLVAPAIRNVVLQGERAIQENKALNSKVITQRIENERVLQDLNTRLDTTQREFLSLGERYSKLGVDMDKEKRLANALKSKNSELDKDYRTLQTAQKRLQEIYKREQREVADLKKRQIALARLNDKVKEQVESAGLLNNDLGKENIALTRLKGELEGKVNAAQDSLAMLRETNEMLKGEGELLQEKNASLTRQNLALYETNRRSEDYNRELRLKNEDLLASNTNLRQQQDIYLAGLRDASETVGAIRQGKLILRAGGELARRVLPAHSRPEAVKNELIKLLQDAHYTALNYKAGIGENGRAVRIISKRIITQAGITNKNEEDSVNAIIDELTATDIPVVIIANTVNNSLVGEQVIIELTPLAVKPVFDKGEKVAESVIDTKKPIEQVVDAIVGFLRQDVSNAAMKMGVIASIDPETGTQQVGVAVARDLVALTERVRKAGGKVLLSAYSAQTMTSAYPLVLKFDVKRLGSNAPEIYYFAGQSGQTVMNADGKSLVMAIDPGRVKCGLAVVSADGTVHSRGIVPTEVLCSELSSGLAAFAPIAVIVGCGTGCKQMIRHIEQAASSIPVYEVEEAYTSEEARKRWLQNNPPTGLQRLMPQSLRCPDAPYDDYVAIILAERWWRQHISAQNETAS